MSNEVWIYTMQEGSTRGKWSHYRFPWTIEYFAHFRGELYCREADRVHLVKERHLFDDGSSFGSILQWQWLDFGKPSVTKYMTGFDLVGKGEANVQVGYDQNDLSIFTDPFTVPEDTLTGSLIPLPVAAPSFSLKITYDSATDWKWDTLGLYLQDHALGK